MLFEMMIKNIEWLGDLLQNPGGVQNDQNDWKNGQITVYRM